MNFNAVFISILKTLSQQNNEKYTQRTWNRLSCRVLFSQKLQFQQWLDKMWYNFNSVCCHYKKCCRKYLMIGKCLLFGKESLQHDPNFSLYVYLYIENSYWKVKQKCINNFLIVVDISIQISHIMIWKQTILKSQWLNTQQFIYLFSQGPLRVQAVFQDSCLPCGSSEPRANSVMWHVHNMFFHDCWGSEERGCRILQIVFFFEFISHP